MPDPSRPDRTPGRRPPVLPVSPACPFCDGVETELISPFGAQLSVAQYWCRKCRNGFDYVK